MTRQRAINDQRQRLLRGIGSAQASRRSVLAGSAGLALAGLLSACGTKSTGTAASAALSPAKDLSDSEKIVNWANWTLYLDYDDETRKYPTLQRFMKESGLEANYVEDIDSNDSYYGKVQSQLSAGQDIGQDLMVLTDWMAERIIRQGYVQDLNHANIPNIKNLLPQLQDVRFDPGRKKSLTWQSGYTGLVWNKDVFPKGLENVEDLWDPALKGRITMLDEMRDTMPMLLLDQGVDIAGNWGQDEYSSALEVLEKNIGNGMIRQVKGNSYKQDLISGDAIAGLAYSGDITQLNFEEGNKWEFALPERGGLLWSDNFMVPMGATHKTNAEKLMDFYYQPDVAAEVAAYVNYLCPVDGAQEQMEKIDPELVSDPLIFPTQDFLKRATTERELSVEEETDFQNQFQEVIGV
ncbi:MULTISPECIES: ABC transporter substrate-binding protein [Glutamicibacter]|uniref:Extracellular solute-binding protein n=3 Tax=Glutamicibacter arilaitensis TaxID=256701 RepID=A0A4Y8TYK9_9MICC|nr:MULTISPECIES: spermidine/putrescine ABC transporter substrate-binding protein [Glutamicibacter]TFH56367.1 extracellular solute-binding protein [Glutamicibacter arilaitensis]CBT76800.1 polyamine ABC transporter, substrate-binding protein [Glutamicibacter arilaitensis Re117]HCH46856.1 spermidine/putrescine ABC transporter substrate-binding protein [Glutamicibacter sp.]